MEREETEVATLDCRSCRYVGTGLFLFVASYMWYCTRSTVYAGSLYKKLPLRLIAFGSLYMSFARFIYLPPFEHLAPEIRHKSKINQQLR
ncbi:unnamed protein product [Thelazia callipaeda]|uniref:DUF4536 domain-containing protein n=1 Tax=Thelazia callipaeda TaxID=103827 RepID=A0A0N5D6E8_THECL|nr:unnamed protein product [Thelazia callipaeda]